MKLKDIFSTFTSSPSLVHFSFHFFHTLPLGGAAQALERQKEYTDAIRIERDELREEVVKLKDILKVFSQCVNVRVSRLRVDVGNDFKTLRNENKILMKKKIRVCYLKLLFLGSDSDGCRLLCFHCYICSSVIIMNIIFCFCYILQTIPHISCSLCP